jgi:hypothetical protein
MPERKPAKLICTECGKWHGTVDQTLRAPNPFDLKEVLLGCPNCKEPNQFNRACDYDDCWKEVCGGLPTPFGYRMVCTDHFKSIVMVDPNSPLTNAKP